MCELCAGPTSLNNNIRLLGKYFIFVEIIFIFSAGDPHAVLTEGYGNHIPRDDSMPQIRNQQYGMTTLGNSIDLLVNIQNGVARGQ